MPTINDLLHDRLVRHQIYLNRLASQTTKELQAILNRYNKRLLDVILVDEQTTPRQLESVIRSVERINKLSYAAVSIVFEKAMQDTAEYEADFQQSLFIDIIGVSISSLLHFTQPSVVELRAAVLDKPINGAKLQEYVSGAELGRFNRIRDAIRREWFKGESVAASIRQAVLGHSSVKFRDGLLALSLRSVEQMTRTVQNGVISITRDLVYSENDHIFASVMWTAALDSHTSSICQKLDGSIFALDKGPRSPAHLQCRSHVTPVVKSWRSLGLSGLSDEEKQRLDGKPPSSLTYSQWLSRQTASVQDEVLGSTRAKLYRQGKVNFDRFTDDAGRRYTLEELAKRERIVI